MSKNNKKLIFVIGMIILAFFSRLLPHPPNFTAIGGIALFGAAHISRKYIAILLPLVILFLSDLIINNLFYTPETFVWFANPWVYVSFICIGITGIIGLQKIKVQNVLLSSLVASVIFFIVSNFGVWLSYGMYPLNATGLMTCYEMAIPFFWNTLVGDIVYCTILFGSFYLLSKSIPALHYSYES